MTAQVHSYMIVRIVHISFFLLFALHTQAQITGFQVEPISVVSVSVFWNAANTRNTYIIYDNDTPLFSTKDSEALLYISPNTDYSFKVCVNITSNDLACSPEIPYRSDVGDLSIPKVFPVDSQRAVFIWSSSLVSGVPSGQLSKEYLVESLGQVENNAKWLPLASARSIPNEGSDQVYTIIVPVIPSVSKIYRIQRFPVFSDSFWYQSLPQTYSGEFNPVTIRSFVPEIVSSPTNTPTNILSASSDLLVKYDLQNELSPACEILSARLSLNLAGSSLSGDGFLRVYGDHIEGFVSDPNIYISNEYAQFMPSVDESHVFIPLDHMLLAGKDAVSLISSWNNGQLNDGLLLDVEHSGLGTSLVFDDASDIELQVAIKNTFDTITIPQSNVITPICPLSSAGEDISVVQDISVVGVPASAVVVNIRASITGTWSSGFLSVAFGKGAIGAQFVSSSQSQQNLEFQSQYSLLEGGFPGFEISGQQMYILFTGDQICIDNVDLFFDFVNENSVPCDPNGNPSPSLSPSPLPTSLNSVSPSSSPLPSASRSPQGSPQGSPLPQSPSPFKSVNIVPPAPVPSVLVSPTHNPVPSLIPSPTPSAAPSRIPQQGTVQPTTAPANEGPIQIVDNNGDVVVVVDLPDQGGGTLVVTPIDAEPNAVGSRFLESLLISLVLLDEFGFETQPTGNVEICIDATGANEEDSCLGFLNEEKFPPTWECEDSCLSRNEENLLCGKTDHFTSFAVLFSGKGGSCGDSDNLIFDEAWKDGVLIASLAAAIIICLLCITIFLAATPIGSRIVRGTEGHRIAKLRNTSSTSDTVVEMSARAV